ncbi:hypothetical protein EVAR_80854_1 [Eumeta japonica]|uniref:Uncharacterized protein n=1 Tax=Eumeta variegata TaxID=151549 RepID=A0A4C1V027_EUMVA|nr:hypothetical protein EVAR_80854_1 [Eumeta japonica]
MHYAPRALPCMGCRSCPVPTIPGTNGPQVFNLSQIKALALAVRCRRRVAPAAGSGRSIGQSPGAEPLIGNRRIIEGPRVLHVFFYYYSKTAQCVYCRFPKRESDRLGLGSGPGVVLENAPKIGKRPIRTGRARSLSVYFRGIPPNLDFRLGRAIGQTRTIRANEHAWRQRVEDHRHSSTRIPLVQSLASCHLFEKQYAHFFKTRTKGVIVYSHRDGDDGTFSEWTDNGIRRQKESSVIFQSILHSICGKACVRVSSQGQRVRLAGRYRTADDSRCSALDAN